MENFAKNVLLRVVLFFLFSISYAHAGPFYSIHNSDFKVNESSQNDVLIWIANETNYIGFSKENFTAIKSKLLLIDSLEAKKIYKQISLDEQDFPRIVINEQLHLKKYISKSNMLGALLITNRMAQQNRIELFDKENGWRSVNIELPESPLPVMKGMKLNNPENLKLILNFAKKSFGLMAHYYLILKGHGSSEFSITPRITLDGTRLNTEELDMILKNQIPVERLGILKKDFLKLIEKSDLLFNIVTLESCSSGLWNTTKNKYRVTKLPNNINYLIVSKSNNTSYKNFNYKNWLLSNDTKKGKTKDFLDTNNIKIIQKDEVLSRSFNSFWLLPLVVTLIWGMAELLNIKRKKVIK